MDGSGDANLGDLSARVAKVAVGGSGDVEYHGDPSLTKHLDGSGDLSQAG